MKSAYFFGTTGRCIEVRSIQDESLLDELKTRMGAKSVVVSDLQIPLNRARLINGYLMDVQPTITREEQTKIVRSERDLRLIASDWVMLSDVPMADSVREKWLAYRQALRDVTAQPDIYNIVWPVAPT